MHRSNKVLSIKQGIALLILALSPALLHSKENVIAVAKSKNIEPYNMALEGFKEELKRQGIPFQLTEYGDPDSKKPQLILTIGSKATEIVVKEVKDTPIVFTMVMDPKKNGFTGPLLTGVSIDISPEKNSEIIKKISRKIKKIGFIYNPKESQTLINEISAHIKASDYEVETEKVYALEDVYAAIRSLGPRIDILWMIPDSMVYTPKSTEDILFYTLREKIPVIGLSSSYTKAGALLSLSCDYTDIGRQTGALAVKILQGAKPSEIPPESPRHTILSINLITAERIGITIPFEVIKGAKDVYK